MEKNILLLCLLLFIGCNNWDNNPTDAGIKTGTEETATLDLSLLNGGGMVSSLFYPPVVTACFRWQQGMFIINLYGTGDGKIYNTGNSYISTYAVPDYTIPEPDTINCFFNCQDNNGKQLFFAGTHKGIYRSTDMGNMWEPVIIKSKRTGQYISVALFDQSQIGTSNSYYLNAYGWDGENNKFISSDNGATWEYSKIQNGKITGRVSFQSLESTVYGTVLMTRYLTASEDASGAYITRDPDKIFTFRAGSHINSLAYDGKNTCYAATSNGIYKSTGSNRTQNLWTLSGLENLNITSFIISQNNLHFGDVFAGTSNGCYCSTNFGDSWYELGYTAENSPVYFYQVPMHKYLSMNDDILIKDNETMFWSSLYFDTKSYVYKPFPQFPANNAFQVPTNTKMKWSRMTNVYGTSDLLQLSADAQFPHNNTITKRISASGDPWNMSITINGLKGKTKYYWRIKSYLVMGSSPWSEVKCFTTE